MEDLPRPGVMGGAKVGRRGGQAWGPLSGPGGPKASAPCRGSTAGSSMTERPENGAGTHDTAIRMRLPSAFMEEARARCGPDVECPALLFGRGAVVEMWTWPRNVAGSPYAFRLDPEEVYLHISAAGDLDLLAVFHTHPGSPMPSPIDLRYMRLWPVVWIIADVYTWGVAAWRLHGGLERVPLETC